MTMEPILIDEGIYQLSVNVDNILFEGMWEIPQGVSVNSYIVKGEKTAIIDGVCGWDGVPETLIELLSDLDIKPEDIDYVVINHMEPDHSGWIENFKKITTDFEIICTAKAEKLLDNFYRHTENIRTVKEGDQLDLGDGRILEFYEIPNVHWPETMMTFDTKSKALFPCDLFGAFGKVEGAHIDDAIDDEKREFLETEAIRYFSNVLSTFAPMVKRAVDKSEGLNPKIIAPGHGLVWKNNPQQIIDDYKRYISYSNDYGKEGVTILWGSMYGNTEGMVDHITKYIEDQGMTVYNHRLPETSWGQALASAMTTAGIIIAAPTYEYNMFPPVAAVMEEVGRKKITKRVAMHFGSYSWASGSGKEVKEIAERYRMKWDFVEQVEFLGNPREGDYSQVEASVDALLQKVKDVANK